MGTVINVAAAIIGGTIGMLIKGGLPLCVRDLIMHSLGPCTLFIGISGVISAMMQVGGTHPQAGGTLLLTRSLGIGAVAGELLCLEDHVEGLAHRLQSMVKSRDDKFVEGFVSNVLVICAGAIAVMGALQDGLTHDALMLITKATLDGITSMVFASTLGIGVVFAAVPLFLYQRVITILTGTFSPLFSGTLIRNPSLVGGVLIFGVGIDLLFGKQMEIGSLLSTLLVPAVWEAL